MENSKKFRPDPKLRLMDQVRQVLRYHHYAYRTEHTYCDWIMRYRLSHITFHSVIGRRRITIQPPPYGLVKFNMRKSIFHPGGARHPLLCWYCRL